MLAALLLAATGVWAWFQLDIEAYPDISDTEVGVITQLNGLPSEEVEQQVTIPVERALNTVPGVISKRSRSIFGLSNVTLTFDDKTDIYRARQLVLEKLKDAELPDGVLAQVSEVRDGQVFIEFNSPNPIVRPGMTVQVFIKLK